MSATRCTFKFHNEEQCSVLVYGNFNHCIIHLELPDKVEAEYGSIIRAKKIRTQEKIDAGDFNFEGAQLVEFSIEGKELNEANFVQATFSGDTSFEGATFSGKAMFSSATFGNNVFFRLVTFSGNSFFHEATFSGNVVFDRATFAGDVKAP